jgi:hypothetical protein
MISLRRAASTCTTNERMQSFKIVDRRHPRGVWALRYVLTVQLKALVTHSNPLQLDPDQREPIELKWLAWRQDILKFVVTTLKDGVMVETGDTMLICAAVDTGLTLSYTRFRR